MKLASAHKGRWKVFRKNEKGGVLISALFAFFFITLIVIGIASITRNQIYQLRLTQDIYEAKAIMSISERYIPEKSKEINTVISYETATVYIEKENSQNYKMTGHFDNDLTLTKDITILTEEKSEQDIKNENLTVIEKETDESEDKIIEEYSNKLVDQNQEHLQNIADSSFEIIESE